MPETITEMIIPNVYIEVRAEGLVGVNGVSLANVGVVGTANRGPVGQVQILSSAAEVKAAFGAADAYSGDGGELTLSRSLDLLFANGARTVYAVRVANAATPASFLLYNGAALCTTLTAKTPGTWGNDLHVTVTTPASAAVVIREQVAVAGAESFTLKRTPAADDRTVVKVTENGRTAHYMGSDLFTLSGVTAQEGGSAAVKIEGRLLVFPAEATPGAQAKIEVTYAVAASNAADVVVTLDGLRERYVAPDGLYLAQLINERSRFVTAVAPTNADAALTPARVGLMTGTNGDVVLEDDFRAALDALANQDVHIVCAPGLETPRAYSLLNAHCEATLEHGRERIAVIGTDVAADRSDGLPDPTYAQQVATQASIMGSDRVLLVAPGVQVTDRVTGQKVNLTGTYAAAAVAGMISRLSAHTSPTNKEIMGVLGLEQELTPAEIKLLLNNRVMVLNRQSGFRVVRGITTSDAPWSQVTTRRIVDYAKAGIRKGAQPYIGRLNNDRVRKALKGTLDGFLTSMVQGEMIVSYKLDVFASRDDEINGRCLVEALIRPTFSIDFVKVIMNLE